MLYPQATDHRHSRPGVKSLPSSFGLVAGLVALSAMAASHLAFSPSRPLEASVLSLQDSDADGLPDAQELVLGTSAFLADSDGDGASDAMELALRTSPVLANDTPAPGLEMGVGMVARGGGGMTTLQIVLYSASGGFDAKVFALSAKAGQAYMSIDLNRLAVFSTVSDVVLVNGAALRSISVELSPLMVQVPGEIHWIGAIGEVGATGFSAAATCRLVGNLADNSVYWTRTGHTLPPNSSGVIPTAGDQISQPIPPDAGDTSNTPGTPGMVCLQKSEVVGTGPGSSVITEIIEADCQTGWAAFCDIGSCSASVGDTFETINPRNLLGG